MDNSDAAFFRRTRGQLEVEPGGSRLAAIVVTMLLLSGWLAWFAAARLAVYAVSDAARLEVDRPPVPVEAPIDGRVLSSSLTMGRMVEAGEMVAQLDVRAQSLGVSEQRARLRGLAPQIARLEAEIAEEINGRRDERAATAAAQGEARASESQAAEAADLAASQEQRLAALVAKGLIQQADFARAQSETRQKRAAVDALRFAGERLAAAQQHQDAEHRVRVERLRREIAARRAEISTGAATLERLEYEGQQRRIVAPVAGTLAEVVTLAVGQVVRAGEAVATIVPDGGLRIVAVYQPAEALGRVRAGQAARLRLDGFPPAQFGSIGAVVSTVARELRDGRVRVELTVARLPPGVPVQHGLPGRVEIEVDRLSPAALVVRAAGLRLGQGERE
ncbi:MAG: HlyD family efflux transporter periplasmic adaptor subunit [Vicinamibacterales bacterium]